MLVERGKMRTRSEHLIASDGAPARLHRDGLGLRRAATIACTSTMWRRLAQSNMSAASRIQQVLNGDESKAARAHAHAHALAQRLPEYRGQETLLALLLAAHEHARVPGPPASGTQLLAMIQELRGLAAEHAALAGRGNAVDATRAEPSDPPSSTRPRRSARDWRAAFNGAPHLALRDDNGQARIELDTAAMAPGARAALSALQGDIGSATVQALIDGFFFGHGGSADGLLGVSAAWRARMGKQPLTGDTLAALIGAIGNLGDGVAVHDFEHLAVGYGTTPVEERLGRTLGAAGYYDTHQTDAIAQAQRPLHDDAGFAQLVRSRVANLERLGVDRPLGTTRPTARMFDEHFSPVSNQRRSGEDLALRFAELLKKEGVLAHLRPDEVAEINRLIFGEATGASIEAMWSARRDSAAFMAGTRPILADIEAVIRRASNRALPSSHAAMLDLFSRELALQTLFVRHGLRFSEVDVNAVLSPEAQWASARRTYGLGSIDFAREFTDTYQEVRAAVDHVLRALPTDGG
jgi:hypothetical protein